ncbi:MAG: dissimilatory sulfite reductase D family protein [Archaeoglobaceae archaeon]
MADYTEEDEKVIKDKLGQKAWKIKDLAKVTKIDKKVVKQVVQDLIQKEEAAYWSSGSTTYVTSPEYLADMEKRRSE